MTEPVRIRIRCAEKVRRKWREACAVVDMDYGELAYYAAKYILENRDDFRKFMHSEERSRPDRDER
jgi:hypothetical protein